jgi:hypothetical protein
MSQRDPRFWMHETSGVLRPAVEAYLRGDEMTAMQIAAMRAYLRQWIMATVWDENPHADANDRKGLDLLRNKIESLSDREAIDDWLDAAEYAGFDPL